MTVLSACSELEQDRDDAHQDRDEHGDPGRHRQLSEDRDAGATRWGPGRGGHGPMLAEPLGVVEPASRDPARGRHAARRVATGRAARHQPLDLGEGRRDPLVLGGDAIRAGGRRRMRRLPRSDDEHELAARRDRARRRPRPPARRGSRGRSTRGASSARGTRPPRAIAAAGRGQVRERRRDPPGRLVHDRRRARRRRSGPAARAARGPSAAGSPRTPSAARPRPMPATAASTAEAPGIGTTVPPSAAQAATSSPPGSLTAGVPASVDERQVRPAAQVLEQRRRPRRPAPGVVAGHPRRRCRGAPAGGACAACPRRRSAGRRAGPRAPGA